MSQLRIVVCGKRASIGGPIIEGLKPDVEVIHFITSLEQALQDLPLILSKQHTKLPEHQENNGLGTGNFEYLPDCIVLGGGYSKENFEEIRQRINENTSIVEEGRKVPFFLVDTTRAAPPPGPAYSELILERLRNALKDWRKGGSTQDGGDVIWF